jgi:hypothetical protein
MRFGRWVSCAVVSVILAVSPLAYSSLPDQTWLSGFYDGVDEDEAALVQVPLLTAVTTSIVHAPGAVGPVALAPQPADRVPPTHVFRPPQTRAPPGPRSLHS